MQRLNTSYALYVHYKRGLIGHVLQGRYKAKLVETDEYLVSLSRQEAEFARLADQQRRIVSGIERFRASDRLRREDLHGRAVR